MRDYQKIQRKTIVTGLDAYSGTFYHDEVSLHYRQHYFECIDTLVLNLVDRFDQKSSHCHQMLKSFSFLA